MNVYRVRSSCEVDVPGKDPRQVYAAAPGRPRGVDMVDHFNGKPYPKKWPAVTLALDRPKLPRPDFFCFDYKVLLCGPRAVDVAGDLLRASGELFPLKIRGADGPCQLLNVTTLLKQALDPAKSVYDERYPDYQPLEVPAFRANKIGQRVCLFKIPQNSGTIYCVERTGQAEDGEFKALVEHHGLTGLRFSLIWSDGKGPKPPVAAEPKNAKVATARTGRAARANPLGSDRPLNAGEKKDVVRSIARGYKHLKISPSTSPAESQRAIRDLIDRIVRGQQKVTPKTSTDLAVNLGCLWGQTVCDNAGWEWCLARVDGKDLLAVAAPDRSHLVSPMHFLRSQLTKRRPGDNTSLLLFNMIKSGTPLSRAQPNTYTQIG